MDMPKIYDQEGMERDWHWLVANFGNVTIERAELPEGVSRVYRVAKLQDAEGPAVKIVHVGTQDGRPLGGIRVVRYWPSAPHLAPWPPPISRWRNQGVHGETNVNGDIGFGMGQGDYYFPPDGGASAVWIAHEAGPSDFVSGLGMLGGTNHRHLDITFELQDTGAPTPAPTPTPTPKPTPAPTPTPTPTPIPTPPPAEDNWATLFAKLDRIIELLAEK